MDVDEKRLWHRLEELGKIGADPEGGVSRFAFTREYREAVDLVLGWMKEAGLETRMDAAGNIFGRRRGVEDAPAIFTGSHLDSVRNGGRFDGAAGVLAALEALQVMNEADITTKLPIEMVIFANEEGGWFPGGLMGSMAIAGKLSEDYAKQIKSPDGITLSKALEDFTGENESLMKAKLGCKPAAFFELHIEQAQLLEECNMPVGVVSGIAGLCQMILRLYGRSGHSGAVPMSLRKDPMVAAGMIISEVERSVVETGSTGRGTVGYIKANPGGHNIIPGEVELTLDYRDIDIQKREKAIERIKRFIDKVCKERGLKYDLEATQDTPPVNVIPKVLGLIRDTAGELQIPNMILPSGAAHDAMIMAGLCPMGMIFLRSRDGLSHCPEEYTTSQDMALGATLLLHTLIKAANGALE